MGSYVRIEITRVHDEFVKYVNFANPIIVGALHTSEEALGFIQVHNQFQNSSTGSCKEAQMEQENSQKQ